LSFIAIAALLIGYQLVATILQPPWIGLVTDWVRPAAAWPALLVAVCVSLWLRRVGRPEALAWGAYSVGLLSYAIARTWWSVDDVLIYHHGVPFPILPDLFFVLQYPFYFLAVICIPMGRYWGPRLKVILDTSLWMGAAAAISWYFLLMPLFLMSGLSPLARAVSMGYPVADLFLLFALMLIVLRPLRYAADRPVVGILMAAVGCLILGDSWAIWLILHPSHVYRTGHVPDLFWLASDLLVPLAAVVQLRMVQRERSGMLPAVAMETKREGFRWDDLKAGLRLFLPIVAALLASVTILLGATMRAGGAGADGAKWQRLIAPLTVSFALLLLAMFRQGVAYLESVQLQRAGEAARARAEALIEMDRRKDEFLGVLSHEIRTPLTSVRGYIHLLIRRVNTWWPAGAGTAVPPIAASPAVPSAREVAQVRAMLASCEQSLERLTRLADDLVDDIRIRDGQLTLRRAPCDLCALVRSAVEAQRALEPDRVIRLRARCASAVDDAPLVVEADADRIVQVIANYLSNALKYSKADRPVEVLVEAVDGAGEGEAGCARVAVRDAGPGLTEAERARVWERFPRIERVTVQSGSGVSLGLGLSICKSIVERHGGEVGVASVPSQGSTFWFTLPLSTGAPPAAAST
jgi:signal transduction histidine kinase